LSLYAYRTLHPQQSFNSIHASLSFFLVLNMLICTWEMSLGYYIDEIAQEYRELQKKYAGRRWAAAAAFMSGSLTFSQAFSFRYWTKVWSTYSLWDPSYSNRESYGYFIDYGNGYSTLLPSVFFLVVMTAAQASLCDARIAGCVGLVSFYQELYGTIIYALSFFSNRRHQGKSFADVVLFVGGSNGLWAVFPLIGMYASFDMIMTNSYSIFL
jgi:hypothetical protein